MSAVSATASLVPAVLRAYSDLCPAPNDAVTLMAAAQDDMILLGHGRAGEETMGLQVHHVPTSANATVSSVMNMQRTSFGLTGSPTAERLARLDALHSDELLLRHGWVLIAGTITVDGVDRRVLQPLMLQPVRLARRSVAARALGALDDRGTAAPYLMQVAGEGEMTSCIEDPAARAHFVDGAQFGGGALQLNAPSEALIRRLTNLSSWIKKASIAAGLPVTRVLPHTEDPYHWVQRRGLVAIVTHCVYLSRHVNSMSLRSTLLGWSARDHLERTAFRAILDATPGPVADPVSQALESPLRLSPSQRSIVLRARTQPVTVVSGAPGSGKTHTVCAIALDAVAEGRSVLVATQSRHAADVVTELLHRTPGPEPVRFGDGAGMTGLIDELSDRQTHPIDSEDVRLLEAELALARTEVEALRASIAEDLQLEADAANARRWQEALPSLMLVAPHVFDIDSDLGPITTLLNEVHAATDAADAGRAGGPVRRWRTRRLRRRLLAATGASPTADLARVALAIDAARAGRAAATLAARGGVRLGDRWDRLAAAEQRQRDALGRRLRARPFEAAALDGAARVALGQLITALRAGRGRRRELLGELHPGELTSAAPLWIGTLSEIEDVLPATAGLFDLVVLDEASQIEQPRAAPALLRASRAVVVGDPHQLRHVSFRSDAEVDRALEQHRLTSWRGLLDTRRVSAFDLAAATTPVDQLRDHFRSIPHLIEFSVRHFYRDRVDVMTRHPRNEMVDAIDRVRTEPTSVGTDGVYHDELVAVLELVRELATSGATSVGIVSPFRDQADALEEALVAEFTPDQIRAMSLRVGTVHAFQGGERDVIVTSLALDGGDSPGRRRFLESPNLFNVMITRARTRMVVVTSLPLEDTGLVGEYLRYAEHGLAAEPDGDAPEGWPRALADELRRNGTAVRRGYPVGPWHLDLCVGEGTGSRFLECTVDAAGPQAHIDRHLTLMGLGWTIVDAYPSAWDGDAVRAALELRERT